MLSGARHPRGLPVRRLRPPYRYLDLPTAILRALRRSRIESEQIGYKCNGLQAIPRRARESSIPGGPTAGMKLPLPRTHSLHVRAASLLAESRLPAGNVYPVETQAAAPWQSRYSARRARRPEFVADYPLRPG